MSSRIIWVSLASFAAERALFNLLNSRLNKEVIGQYMDMFDRYCDQDLEDGNDELTDISRLTREINGQITQQQKIFLVSEITQLIYADNILSDSENKAIHDIGKDLNIEDDELKSIPVIAVTAFAMKGDEEKIREGGCEAYIAKPISVSHFIETVRKFVG